MAARAAGRQGKYWEFHDELYKNYNGLNDEKINEIAKQLGLNETEFQEDQKNPAILEQIRQDYELSIDSALATYCLARSKLSRSALSMAQAR